MRTNPFKKTKAQLAREKNNRENSKKSMAALRAFVARLGRKQAQIQKD